MTWLTAAIISAFALSGQALFFQKLQKLYPITTFMSYVWLGSAVLLGLIFLRPPDFELIKANIVPLVLAGLTSFFGIYAYNQSIKLQNNIGYIEAVVSIRTAITFVFSIIAFNAPFDMLKLLGVVAITVGVLAVSEAFPVQQKVKTDAPMDNVRGSTSRLGWLRWALIATVMFTLMPIFLRFATDNGAPAEVSLVVVLVVAGILFALWGYAAKTSLKIERQHIMLILMAIAVATIGNVADFISFQKTPNLAYAIAISNTRMIILYILGMVLFSEKLQSLKAVGIALTFIGVILLV
jgi:drug/metabolite transporter (DMT)-like permease